MKETPDNLIDYSQYVDKILENIGRCPDEIAIAKYNITYKNLITALISTKNTQEAALLLQLPTYSIQNAMYLRLNKELPEKQNKSSWNIVLLDSLGLFKCSMCNIIYDLDNKSRTVSGSRKNQYSCKNCISKESKMYYENNAELIKDKSKQHYLNNKSYYSEKRVRYELDKINRIPNWANLDKIKEIYFNCPEGYHVDHIIPLKGKKVSGLHVENNLQYLLPKDNLSKGNRYDIS